MGLIKQMSGGLTRSAGTVGIEGINLNKRDFIEFLRTACSVLHNITHGLGDKPVDLKSAGISPGISVKTIPPMGSFTETKLINSLDYLIQSQSRILLTLKEITQETRATERQALWLTPYKNSSQE